MMSGSHDHQLHWSGFLARKLWEPGTDFKLSGFPGLEDM